MSTNRTPARIATRWEVRPTGLPLIRRRCPSCPSLRYRADGKFRVNANHKLLDVWLLALCVGCGRTGKFTVLERAHVRTVDPSALDLFHANDRELAAQVLDDPAWWRRNDVTTDWDGAWAVHRETAADPAARVIDTSVRFTRRIPVRLTRLLAAGLEVSRAEVRRLIAAGDLTSAHRLTGNASGDFSFTLRRPCTGDPATGHRPGR